MSEKQDENTNTPKPPAGKPAPTERGDRMRRWHDVVEEKLAQARERGEFDNLPGAGPAAQSRCECACRRQGAGL